MMPSDELKHPPIEKELGLRSGFTDKERKFSEYTIMKQVHIKHVQLVIVTGSRWDNWADYRRLTIASNS